MVYLFRFYFTAQETNAFHAQHSDVFPSKNILQLKIREVRQKLYATSRMDEEEEEGGCGSSNATDSTPVTTPSAVPPAAADRKTAGRKNVSGAMALTAAGSVASIKKEIGGSDKRAS